MDEFTQKFLENSNEYLTADEVRALIASSMKSVTSPLTVASSYMQSQDFTSGSKGWQIKANGDVEFNSGTFRGSLEAGSINIPDTTTANSMHVESDGDTFWGCNVADFTADNNNAKAYVLKTGVAKFTDVTLGSSSKYFLYDGTNADANEVRYLKTYEAGEDITADNIVCLKPTYTDFIATQDSYIDELTENRGTNYGTEVYIDVAVLDGHPKTGYIKFNLTNVPSASEIIKAELRLNVYAFTGSARDVTIKRVSSADWDESTIVWTGAPTATNDIGSVYGMETTENTGANPMSPVTALTWDITQMVRHWKDGYLNNYGITVQDESGSILKFYSSEASVDSSLKPTLRVWSTYNGDGKVYKADCDDYLLSRCIIGVATETKSSGQDVRVQFQGNVACTTGTATGGRVYLSDTAGGILTSSTNVSRMISLGKITEANKFDINIQDNDILIEKLYNSLTKTADARRFYAPNDARYALLYLRGNDTSSLYTTVVRINRDNAGLDTFYYNYESGSPAWTITWTANYITIDGSGAENIILDILFYT